MSDEHLPRVDDLARVVQARSAEGTAADRLRAAIEVDRQLGETADALLERYVTDARAAGMSWAQVGDLFGTSKQAAHKRYGATRAERGAWPGPWALGAREALTRATEQARDLHHDYVGTEHALLGLLAAPDVAAGRVLAALGVTREAVLSELSGLLGPCDPPEDPGLRVMPRLKQALEHAQRIASGLGHRTADAEHVLAGILSVPDALAVKLLARQGVSTEEARGALARHLGIDPQRLAATGARRRRRLVRA